MQRQAINTGNSISHVRIEHLPQARFSHVAAAATGATPSPGGHGESGLW